MTAPDDIPPCPDCQGDGCPACGYSGLTDADVILAGPFAPPPMTPRPQ